MRHVLKSLGVAAGLVLVVAACGIKGSPKPPLPAPTPSTETQSPSEERAPIEPSGPIISPGQDAGTGVPDTVVPDTVVPPDTETP
ncbi:hypothetical protein [Pyxidicoccus trucidator]|jgi:predicted small lipoprotein YifL|uniref:hypothetical protein n=1 Tax=Pyxidicoccus trucidator TaxID=2709662 RepID=UPI0013DA8CF7|nr:hypothetical protein [Pyxidicoccus trucidator]